MPLIKRRRGGARAADLRFSALTFDTWKQQHVQPRALDDARHSALACKVDLDVGEQDSSFNLQVPCTLHLVPCPRRGVDVQLRLVSLQVGGCSATARHNGDAFGSGNSAGLLRTLNRAAALLLVRLLFPEAAAPLSRALIRAWSVASTVEAAAWALGADQRRWVAQRLTSLARGLKSLGALARAYGEPAAALAAAAALWAYVHPTSEQIGRCVAALIPVLAGYNRTARDSAAGRFGDVLDVEQAWHRRHKWAAQRLAPLLDSLPATPPIKPLLDAWERLDISVAAVVPGGPPGGWGLNGGSDFSRGGHTQGCQAAGGSFSLQLAASVGRKAAATREAGAATGQGRAAGREAAGSPCLAAAQAGPPAAPALVFAPAAAPALPAGATSAPVSAALPAAAVPRAVPAPAGRVLPANSPCSSAHAEGCRFTPDQLARLRAYQEASRALLLPSPSPVAAQYDDPTNGHHPSTRPAAALSQEAVAQAGLVGNGLPAATRPVKISSQAQLTTGLASDRWEREGSGRAAAGGRAHHRLPAEGATANSEGGSSCWTGSTGSSWDSGDERELSAPPTPTAILPAPGVRSSILQERSSSSSASGSSSDLAAGCMPAAVLAASSQAGLRSTAATTTRPEPVPGQQPQRPLNPAPAPRLPFSTNAAAPAAVQPPPTAAAPAVQAPPTALYGRADHSLGTRRLTPQEQGLLLVRAVELVCIFTPFLLLAGLLLLLLACLRPARRTVVVAAAPPAGALCVGAGGAVGVTAGGGAAAGGVPTAAVPVPARRWGWQRWWVMWRGGRRVQLGPAVGAAAGLGAGQQAVLVPPLVQVPVPGGPVVEVAAPARRAVGEEAALVQLVRGMAWRALVWACRRGGAAFIKWGQWAATREDVFPEDLCRALCELHDRAPQHTYLHTRLEVLRAFGRPIEALFESFEPLPLASGSIAQVHRAVLRVGGLPCQVAVKVRHPGVARQIWQDFQLLRPLAALTSTIPSLRGLQLKDSVAQFSHTMTAQTDLRVEAAHLQRFAANFDAVGSSVVVPRLVAGLVSEAVLVETFEPGMSVAHYLRTPHPRNGEVVALGVDAYLQMLLRDNFVHTDLHPGNILIRTPDSEAAPGAQGAPTGPGRERLQIVLLDFGLAEELTPAVRTHFISFLNMIAKGDGRQAAAHLLQWSARQQCPRPLEFVADMEALFARQCDINSEAGIDLDRVMKNVLHLARRHEVAIDSSYAALVVGICVLVGFATSLDPRVNLMDAAAPCLLYYSLTGRVTGRLYM
ncbi:hypothetical protein N2152v2_004585 [Parachlorella kessleri]